MKRIPKFRVTLSSREHDPNLKMNLKWDIGIEYLPHVIALLNFAKHVLPKRRLGVKKRKV